MGLVGIQPRGTTLLLETKQVKNPGEDKLETVEILIGRVSEAYSGDIICSSWSATLRNRFHGDTSS